MARPSPGQPQSPATNTHQYEGIGQAGHGGGDNTRFAKISVIANLRMNLFQALLHIPVAACATLALGAVHILRKHILGSLDTLGGVVSTW